MLRNNVWNIMLRFLLNNCVCLHWTLVKDDRKEAYTYKYNFKVDAVNFERTQLAFLRWLTVVYLFSSFLFPLIPFASIVWFKGAQKLLLSLSRSEV